MSERIPLSNRPAVLHMGFGRESFDSFFGCSCTMDARPPCGSRIHSLLVADPQSICSCTPRYFITLTPTEVDEGLTILCTHRSYNSHKMHSTLAPILTTSPQSQRHSRGLNLASYTRAHRRPSHLDCQESYRLFKMCSITGGATEGYSCSDAVASYMHCALNDCSRQR
jgi:hypothetical protein